jgi:hypothetical protein
MQDTRVVVSATGEYIPQRVLSEPVFVTWVAIGKAVNAMAYDHYLKIPSEAGIHPPRNCATIWSGCKQA